MPELLTQPATTVEIRPSAQLIVELASPQSISSFQTEAVIAPDTISQIQTINVGSEAERVAVDEVTFNSVPEHSGDLQSMLKQAELRGRPIGCPFIRSMGSKGIELAQKWVTEQQQAVEAPKPTMRELLAQKKASEHTDKTQSDSRHKSQSTNSEAKVPQAQEVKPSLPLIIKSSSIVLGHETEQVEKPHIVPRNPNTSEFIAKVVSQNEIQKRLSADPAPLEEHVRIQELDVSAPIYKTKKRTLNNPVIHRPDKPVKVDVPHTVSTVINADPITLNRREVKTEKDFQPIKARIKANVPYVKAQIHPRSERASSTTITFLDAVPLTAAVISPTKQVVHVEALAYNEPAVRDQSNATLIRTETNFVYENDSTLDSATTYLTDQTECNDTPLDDVEVRAFSGEIPYEVMEPNEATEQALMEGSFSYIDYYKDETESKGNVDANADAGFDQAPDLNDKSDLLAELYVSDLKDERCAIVTEEPHILERPVVLAPSVISTDTLSTTTEPFTRMNSDETPALEIMDDAVLDDVLRKTLIAAGNLDLASSEITQSTSGLQQFEHIVQLICDPPIEILTDPVALESYETSVLQLCFEFLANTELQDAGSAKQFLTCLKQSIRELNVDNKPLSLKELGNSGTHEHKFGHKVSPFKLIQNINQTVRQQLFLGKCVLAAVAA